MKWPWVSRGRYEDMRERVDQLQKDIDRAHQIALDRDAAHERAMDTLLEEYRSMTDAFTRIQRFQRGMVETPREKRTPAPADIELSPALNDYVQGFDSPSIRHEQRRVIRRRHSAGESMQDIEDDILGGVSEAQR